MDNYWNGEIMPINANTGMPVSVEGQVTTLDPSGNAQPFGHLQRLSDKLLGSVIFAAEAALDDAMNPDDVAKPAPQTASFLPQGLATYVNRNMGVVAIGAIILLLGLIFARR